MMSPPSWYPLDHGPISPQRITLPRHAHAPIAAPVPTEMIPQAAEASLPPIVPMTLSELFSFVFPTPKTAKYSLINYLTLTFHTLSKKE